MTTQDFLNYLKSIEIDDPYDIQMIYNFIINSYRNTVTHINNTEEIEKVIFNYKKQHGKYIDIENTISTYKKYSDMKKIEYINFLLESDSNVLVCADAASAIDDTFILNDKNKSIMEIKFTENKKEIILRNLVYKKLKLKLNCLKIDKSKKIVLLEGEEKKIKNIFGNISITDIIVIKLP